jgi:hypothetical protein
MWLLIGGAALLSVVFGFFLGYGFSVLLEWWLSGWTTHPRDLEWARHVVVAEALPYDSALMVRDHRIRQALDSGRCAEQIVAEINRLWADCEREIKEADAKPSISFRRAKRKHPKLWW